MLKRDLSDFFAAVLRKHRKSAKMTQEKLSEKADVDTTMIGLIERGIRNPSLNLADSLAEAMGLPLSLLIAEAETLRQAASTKRKSKSTISQ